MSRRVAHHAEYHVTKDALHHTRISDFEWDEMAIFKGFLTIMPGLD